MDDEQQDDDVLVVGDAIVTQAPLVTEQDLDALYGEDEDEEDLDDEDLALDDPRVAQLERTVRELAGAEAARQQKRVRRKVTAATGGAGAVGFIPILLQLLGALDLDPEVASAIVVGAATLGALIAGYMTPERKLPQVALD